MSTPILNGRYKIRKRLSQNGARQTWLAQDMTTDALVVIKLLFLGHEFTWEEYKLFERGAGALKALEHPNIPRFLDYFDVELQNSKGFAQVQTYIPAKSLQEHLQAGRTFSESEIRQIARDLLKILIYLHSRQPAVIHRDIKPSNILLGDRTGNSPGTVYLVDFDSVQVHSAARTSNTMTVVGTYGYMPPEQFGGQTCPASDLYSLGAALIYIVTGKHPAELFQDGSQIQFDSLVNLSADLISWLKWMTDPDLKKRLPTAEQALQTLDQPNAHPRYQTSDRGGAIAKPDDSNIVLRRQSTTLEVLASYNPVENSQGLLYLAIGLAVLGLPSLMTGLFMLLGGLTSLMTGILSAEMNSLVGGLIFFLFSLVPLGVAIAFTLPLFFCLPRQRQLVLDARSITLTRKVLVWRKMMKGDRQSLRQLICKFQPKEIILVAGYQKFVIPLKTLAEVEWLAQELSLWLKVPITKL